MIWLLLVLYQIKHFLCDYPLQGAYMLGKFKKYPDFILPLLAHSAVHGVATFLIALVVKPKIAFWVALFDMVVHFTMDRIKASPDMLGKFKAISKSEYLDKTKMIESLTTAPEPRHPEIQFALNEMIKDFHHAMQSNALFWWSLGLDQGVHHLTHYLIIYCLL